MDYSDKLLARIIHEGSSRSPAPAWERIYDRLPVVNIFFYQTTALPSRHWEMKGVSRQASIRARPTSGTVLPIR